MSFIFFIIFMTVVAIGAPFILKFIFPHKITWKEVGVSITASIVISLLSSLVLIQGILTGYPKINLDEYNIIILSDTKNKFDSGIDEVRVRTQEYFEVVNEIVKIVKTCNWE